MVPGRGVEPLRLAPTDFKSVVSTYSTTRARNIILLGIRNYDSTAAGSFKQGHKPL